MLSILSWQRPEMLLKAPWASGLRGATWLLAEGAWLRAAPGSPSHLHTRRQWILGNCIQSGVPAPFTWAVSWASLHPPPSTLCGLTSLLTLSPSFSSGSPFSGSPRQAAKLLPVDFSSSGLFLFLGLCHFISFQCYLYLWAYKTDIDKKKTPCNMPK